MIGWSVIFRMLGTVLLGLAGAIGISTLVAVVSADAGLVPLASSTAITAAVGTLLLILFPSRDAELRDRDAMLLVSLIWTVVGIFGALPFYLSPYFPSFTDAVFESLSGFTTTGSSILTDVSQLPGSLHFWRAATQWLGGMGIVVMVIAIFPMVGAGGVRLYRSEFSGARSERVRPRIAETARSLWRIYVGFTAAGYLALRLAGLSPLDSICHTFAAIATGGFSTQVKSVEEYASLPVELILIVLMTAGGINFIQHYRVFYERQPSSLWNDLETRLYLGILAAATLGMGLVLWHDTGIGPATAIRKAAFQAVSIMTTTGFSSVDFALWPAFCQFSLLILMFVGGATGSTAGGLKVARFGLIWAVLRRRLTKISHPRAVLAVRWNDAPVEDRTVEAVLGIVAISIVMNLLVTLYLTFTGLDIVTAFSASAATMFDVGPGLGGVGPASNYAHLHASAKWLLVLNMLAGRLEFVGLLTLFSRAFWRP